MCGRFTLSTPANEIAELFELADVPELQPRYNIAPTQSIAAVRIAGDGGQRKLDMFRWGLVPFWAKDPGIGARMINARAETLAEKPSFRAAFRQRRCLVPADGFYEWRKAGGGKQPYLVRMQDGRPFAMAGLWEHWQRGDDIIRSCTLITTDANELLRPIHPRMPVILAREHFDRWLDPQVDDAQLLRPLLVPCASEPMVAFAVSMRVNSPANDTADLVAPLSEEPRAS